MFTVVAFLLLICTSFPSVSIGRILCSVFWLLTSSIVEPRRHPDEVRVEGKRMYERMTTLLEEAQTIWPLASGWLAGLRKWFNDTNTSRISFESGTMTDGVRFYFSNPCFPLTHTLWTARSSTPCTSPSADIDIGLAEQNDNPLSHPFYGATADGQTPCRIRADNVATSAAGLNGFWPRRLPLSASHLPVFSPPTTSTTTLPHLTTEGNKSW